MATATHTIIVEHGETLSHIAERLTGKASRWRELYALNHDALSKGPHWVSQGVELVVPNDWVTHDHGPRH